MAKAERRGNPLGWIVLGFVVGAVAALGVILVVSAGVGFDNGGYQEGPEVRTAADDAASAAVTRTPAAQAAPAATPEPEKPPVVEAPAAPKPAPEVDPQMADDAAAAGMTSRTRQ
ncbi:hypothetical protein DMC25_12285 [Caulobacter sp. D4A]|uniref:hypothetical protein n=1 Tax=unclassified Caulobacter TaxID=2648921 RepID=UPI000D72FB4F|nr:MULTISPECIES: hypothetical protein [unclassified Caulobacter]PXA87747.1 hypothetical protein DMC25_12285 [Caulobacter sp. D4A]PXA96375.1 hypothetical protein DMC18_01610 [Caulobacter sp. D5]